MKTYKVDFKANGNKQTIELQADNKKDLTEKIEAYLKQCYPDYEIEILAAEK